MSRRPDARTLRDQPYLGDHVASQRRRPPRSFEDLVAWLVEGYAAETPRAIHAGGLWVGRPPRVVERVVDGKRRLVPSEDIPADLVGGSELGSPKDAEPMRQLMENSPRQIAGDGLEEHYVRPMRAALARLSGRHDCVAVERRARRCPPRPLMAHYLTEIAIAGGDWRAVGDRWDYDRGTAEIMAGTALRELARIYRRAPSATDAVGWVDMSESARAAVVDGEKRGAA